MRSKIKKQVGLQGRTSSKRLMSHNNELPVRSLLKPSEVAARLNIPLSTIYFWYRMGNISGINVNGRCLRIFTRSLQEFLESRISRGGQDPMSESGVDVPK